MWTEITTHKPVNAPMEMGAYEYLWKQPGTSTKRLAKLFEDNPASLPSDLVDETVAAETASEVYDLLSQRGVSKFGIRVNGTLDYPVGLRDAKEPVEIIYYMGDWRLIDAPNRVSVVGTREVSEEGAKRTRKLVAQLVEHGFTIVSGLARGVDTIAHQTALACGGRTIAVIGTPISEVYPKENANLQHKLAKEHLVVSQVPVLRYLMQTPTGNRLFFPERNKTMSALTQATIIVEAGETSGTLIQARAALEQGRKLFILESNFHNSSLTWPARLEQQGALRVRRLEDILDVMI